ncbi:MAG: GIY-YIG nuclease family protein [Clostridia bacterium]|jgi:uncharacterized protein YxjI
MDRRKELKEQYKNSKPDMGVIIIKSEKSRKCYLEATRNIKGAINKSQFTLDMGSHINKELQKDWNELGASSFKIMILEKLDYDENKQDHDYREELAILRLMCIEKLSEEGILVYN